LKPWWVGGEEKKIGLISFTDGQSDECYVVSLYNTIYGKVKRERERRREKRERKKK